MFKPKKDNGKNTYYYACDYKDCWYQIKVQENTDLLKNLTLTGLITSFKDFELDQTSELPEGICHITQYGEHKDQHHKNPNQIVKFTKQGSFVI